MTDLLNPPPITALPIIGTARHGAADIPPTGTTTTRCHAVRERILRLCASPDGGHLGGSMSLVEILVQLYTSVLNVSPERAGHPDRDFFVLSKGHGALCLYAVLAECGFLDDNELRSYGQPGTRMFAHPSAALPGVEIATGSLGHGLSVALGVAVAARLRNSSRRIVTVVGDGELQEGSNWEAAMFAGARELPNLMVVVDRNGLQITGPTERVTGPAPLSSQWQSFGWEVREVDGHDTGGELLAALSTASRSGRPVAVIAATEKGHGVPAVAGQVRSHFATLKSAQLQRAIASLGDVDDVRPATRKTSS